MNLIVKCYQDMFWPCAFLALFWSLHKPGKKCLNMYREGKPHNFTISGCTSINTYWPKYCGVCTDERCCIPYKSKTVEVDFQCPNGSSFTWQIMWINACFCNLSCKDPNDIFTDLELYHERGEVGDLAEKSIERFGWTPFFFLSKS